MWLSSGQDQQSAKMLIDLDRTEHHDTGTDFFAPFAFALEITDWPSRRSILSALARTDLFLPIATSPTAPFETTDGLDAVESRVVDFSLRTVLTNNWPSCHEFMSEPYVLLSSALCERTI